MAFNFCDQDHGGAIDVLIHNANAFDQSYTLLQSFSSTAGYQSHGGLFDASIRTAIYGNLWSTNAFLPLIETGTEKKVVHISTIIADLDFIKSSGIENALVYAVAKAGMNVQVTKYAVELAPRGIKVLALSPGWVDTFEGAGPKPPQLIEAIDKMREQLKKLPHPLEGPMDVEESVKMQLNVIESLDLHTSGSFLSHLGAKY
ncbi:NAD(P)-binding domain protein, partial [Metarhizium brunneum ARSEF 3297]